MNVSITLNDGTLVNVPTRGPLGPHPITSSLSYGKLVSDWVTGSLNGSDLTNASQLQSHQISASYAVRYHNDYVRVLEDNLSYTLNSLSEGVESAQTGENFESFHTLVGSYNKTLQTVMYRIQLLEAFVRAAEPVIEMQVEGSITNFSDAFPVWPANYSNTSVDVLSNGGYVVGDNFALGTTTGPGGTTYSIYKFDSTGFLEQSVSVFTVSQQLATLFENTYNLNFAFRNVVAPIGSTSNFMNSTSNVYNIFYNNGSNIIPWTSITHYSLTQYTGLVTEPSAQLETWSYYTARPNMTITEFNDLTSASHVTFLEYGQGNYIVGSTSDIFPVQFVQLDSTSFYTVSAQDKVAVLNTTSHVFLAQLADIGGLNSQVVTMSVGVNGSYSGFASKLTDVDELVWTVYDSSVTPTTVTVAWNSFSDEWTVISGELALLNEDYSLYAFGQDMTAVTVSSSYSGCSVTEANPILAVYNPVLGLLRIGPSGLGLLQNNAVDENTTVTPGVVFYTSWSGVDHSMIFFQPNNPPYTFLLPSTESLDTFTSLSKFIDSSGFLVTPYEALSVSVLSDNATFTSPAAYLNSSGVTFTLTTDTLGGSLEVPNNYGVIIPESAALFTLYGLLENFTLSEFSFMFVGAPPNFQTITVHDEGETFTRSGITYTKNYALGQYYMSDTLNYVNNTDNEIYAFYYDNYTFSTAYYTIPSGKGMLSPTSGYNFYWILTSNTTVSLTSFRVLNSGLLEMTSPFNVPYNNFGETKVLVNSLQTDVTVINTSSSFTISSVNQTGALYNASENPVTISINDSSVPVSGSYAISPSTGVMLLYVENDLVYEFA